MRSLILSSAATVLCSATIASAGIVISSDPTQNMNCSGGVCTATANNAVLNVTDLASLLASSNVTVRTSGRKDRGHNIELDAALSWTSANSLALSSAGTLRVNASIVVAGAGGLNMSGEQFLSGREISLARGASITFWDLNSSLMIDGGPYVLVGDVATLASDIAANPTGTYALANDYDASNDRFSKAPIPSFNGRFEGLNHAISNLTIKHSSNGCEGLIGTNSGSVQDIALKAVSVSSRQNPTIGSVAGCNRGVISNVWVDGAVVGNSSAIVGGLVGWSTGLAGAVQNASAAVSVSGGQAGGLIGENEGIVSESYATGPVTGLSGTGGLVGSNRLSIQNSYATGAVSGNGGNVGGLTGFNDGTVQSSYSTGAVIGSGLAGGFVGYDPLEGITTCYWDTDTSGISNPGQGAGYPANDPGITGLTTALLQSRLPNGFLKSIWQQDSNVNNGYPYLKANPPQ